ncbi:ATP-dependent DNA helicase [Spirabiliibacterium falconis]|uniref:ATP-dependent DNA helicase n=1 Tax=Spirabiliibacterium falconis TaxID=572023 RepID=UPI001AAC5B31|nr:ATP-dependent DNA helicase [Spirabiliibacterium falconis]MBE2894013.1 ATP-dependent DNA helicase [Spirabiliibacterium falconis]
MADHYKTQLDRTFSPDGILAQHIQGFQPRVEQTTMASAVGEAIVAQSQLVIEAGTGTGKTFAYLVPAMLSGKKTIISTGSKNLQDQLYKRDLPTIQKALQYSGKLALLKGRSNYLCLERLDKLIAEGVLGDRSVLTDLHRVRKWQAESHSGDLSECRALAEDSPLLPQLTSTAESCLGSDCPQYKECYVVKARKKALEADLVVVNHHLFCADMAVKEGGFGELIPNADIVIFDEAHQLPDIASHYFGQSISSRQLFDLCRDTTLCYRTELKDAKQLATASDHMQKMVQDFRLLLGEGNVRGNLREFLHASEAQSAVATLSDNLVFLRDVVKTHLGRSPTIDSIYERINEIIITLERICHTEQTGYCYWFETFNRHFTLHITPLTVAEKFGQQLQEHAAAWIFTSATLEVGGRFDFFCQRMGITHATEIVLSSPFDYQKQAMLCVPRFLPASNQRNTANRLGEMLQDVIESNQGRCFLLCTSYQMMRDLADFLRENSQLNVLCQGQMSKIELLRQFSCQSNSVLVATASFWEGIDVRGDSLSLVIIDKLPFTAPDEPLLKARIEDCRLRGGDPFYDIQLPSAVITLKQGVGRLIRDMNDRGVIIICDSRLVMRPYGQTFIKSLPNAKRTRDLAKAKQFLMQTRE